jgi:hypothetical protein
MKLATDPRALEKIGVSEELEFSIEVTPQAMEVLSGLYSDIPWAIVREYGTNMLDAYVKLPKGEKRIPPQLHVPNTMEPWIEFKDFGTGMNEQSLRTIFTRYFASTKRDNNDEVGGLGLGAKTAFCYEPAESWIVESRFNGEKFVFHASKNEKHIPSLNLIGKFPTNEHSGVTIKISVASGDIPRFRTACERLLRFYPIPVDVIGAGPGFPPPPLEYTLRGKNWGLRKIEGTHEAGSTAIMGNVPYPIVAEELQKNTKFDERFRSYYKANWAIDLWVPIGALRIVPSREGLMYTPQTRKTLAAAVDEFMAELPGIATSMIENAPTKWAALTELQKLFVEPLRTMISGTKWKGQSIDLTDGMQVKLRDVPAGVVVRKLQNESRKCVFREEALLPASPEDRNALFAETVAVSAGGRSVTHISRGDVTMKLMVEQKRLLFIDDLPKGGIQLCKMYMMNQCSRVNYRQRREWTEDGTAYIFTGITKNRLQQLFGGAPVQTATELLAWKEALTKDDAATAAIPPRKPTKVRLYDAANEYTPWSETEIDANVGGYFVPLHNDDPTNPKLNNPKLFKLRKNAVKLGYMLTSDQIIGIPRSCQTLERKPGWVDIVAFIEEKLRVDLAKNWEGVATWRTWEPIMEGEIGEVVCAILENPPTKGKSRQLWARMRKAMPDVGRLRALSDLAKTYEIPVPPDIKPAHNGQEEFKALLDTYPILQVFKAIGDQRKKPYGTPVPLMKYTAQITDYLNS